MKLKILVLILGFAASLNAQKAEILRGRVVDEKAAPIVGAHVFWMDKSAETLSDENGKFELPRRSKSTMVHVEFVGYERVMQTLKADETDLTIQMQTPKTLKTVEIEGKRGDNVVSTLDPRNVERISSKELKKAPCCNLSESFETNGTVDVTYSDAITGAKEIQMLGLRGIYSQLMVENRPDFYGLATPFALEYLPGTWLEGISLSKGTGSVVNGMQAITGQINTELQKPGKDKPVFVNLFAEGSGRVEANVHLNKVINEHWSTGLLLHGSLLENRLDRDGDGFVNMPLKKHLNGLYRLFFDNEKWCGQINIHALTERRESGQIADNQSVANPFLINIRNDRLSVFGKLGLKKLPKPYQQLGSQWSATWHDLNSTYGKNHYFGTQRSAYGNVIYATIIGTTDNKLSIGASGQVDDYREFLNDKNLSRTEGLVGAFGEYTFSRAKLGDDYNDITFIAGLRADYHNLFGTFITPRINFKYNFNEGDVVRFAAGRGVRVASPIAENVSSLATNREIIVAPNLKPEDAWNIGISAVKTLKINGSREARLSFDAYRTQFTNQIVVDLESDYRKAQFYNLDGQSFSNTILTMLTVEILRGLDVKLAYKFQDVQSTFGGKLEQVPLVAKHRGLATLDYKTADKRWSFNATAQLIGQQRLADRSATPHEYLADHHFAPYSPTYALFNASVNRHFSHFEIYGGAENLGDFTQHQPIIAASDPTSIYFDATQVYAPLMGRRIYAGLRWWL